MRKNLTKKIIENVIKLSCFKNEMNTDEEKLSSIINEYCIDCNIIALIGLYLSTVIVNKIN